MNVYQVRFKKGMITIITKITAFNKLICKEEATKQAREYFGTVVGVETRITDTKAKNI